MAQAQHATSRAKPSEIVITTYNVGFGDCFLLTFRYPKFERHILIDFGSTGLPKGAPKDQLMCIAKDIARRTRGKLHAVVATHRHKDHINGFATNHGKGTGDIIRRLQPDVVVQPWTEDPKARKAAEAATRTEQSGPARLSMRRRAGLPSETLHHIAALQAMHGAARAAVLAQKGLRTRLDPSVANALAFIGETNLENPSAIENLATMVPKSGQRFYVNADGPSGLERVLPGVKIHVLGPPTLKQSAAIRSERQTDPVEFWHFWQRQVGAAALAVPFPDSMLRSVPPSAQWFRRRIIEAYGDSLLALVRSLDDTLNNTSVILLFEAGNKRLLFPGDAQIENWAYALSKEKYRKLLADVNLYKVGHHGSLNATPKKSLWALFKNRSRKKTRTRLQTLVSTLADKHGDSTTGTEVPRKKLIAALKAETDYFTTQSLRTGSATWWERRISVG